jgi:DNA-binding MarR family transcriptional regulator
VDDTDRSPAGVAAKTVTFSAEDVRHALRLLRRLTATESTQESGRTSRPARRTSFKDLLAVARLFLVVRNGRTKHFPRSMFGEPAWDVLLVLYLNELEDRAPTISSLAKIIGTPVTTTLRWIDYLDQKQLIERQPSDYDRRASTVRLSQRGRSALEDLFSEVLGAMAAMRREIAGDASLIGE